MERFLAERGLHRLCRAARSWKRSTAASARRWRRCSAAASWTGRWRGLPESDRVLHIDLDGRDPDDGVTLVPYEKGALLLRTIEKAVGRERFDAFLRRYFDHFAFHSIKTAEFLEFIRRELPNPVPLDEWIYQPGIPAAPPSRIRTYSTIDVAAPLWTTHEWLHFLRSQRTPDLPALDGEFHLTQSGNSEILAQWLQMAVAGNYEPAFARLEEFLCSVGRRKFLKPLYTEMMKTPDGRERARDGSTRRRGRATTRSRSPRWIGVALVPDPHMNDNAECLFSVF